MAFDVNPSEKQLAFIEHMAKDVITPTEGARRAGYSDPAMADELMAIPGIAAAILKAKNKELVSWHELSQDARRVLNAKMQDTRRITIVSECKVCGEETKHTSEVPIKDMVQLSAARIVYQTLSKASPDTIADKASKEDVAETLGEVAKRVLGSKPQTH